MSNISLYRKYRPDCLDKIVGQEFVKESFKNAIINNNVSHSYLFYGTRGSGKTTVARIISKTLNCLNKRDYNPCNECINCKTFDENRMLDSIEIDAASNNGVDEIRLLKEKIKLLPTNAKHKIYIIDEVHMLTTSAFNALLKTLEEPPAHAIFILATTDIQKIPATILSRCQNFIFQNLKENEIISNLKEIAKKEKVSCDEESYKKIAQLSNGSIRDSLSIFEQLISFTDKNITVNDINKVFLLPTTKDLNLLLENLFLLNTQKVIEIIKNFENKGIDFIQLLNNLLLITKEILEFNLTKSESFLKNIDLKNLKTNNNSTNSENILFFSNLLITSLNNIKETSNLNIFIEITLLNFIDKVKNNKSEAKVNITTTSKNFISDKNNNEQFISTKTEIFKPTPELKVSQISKTLEINNIEDTEKNINSMNLSNVNKKNYSQKNLINCLLNSDKNKRINIETAFKTITSKFTWLENVKVRSANSSSALITIEDEQKCKEIFDNLLNKDTRQEIFKILKTEIFIIVISNFELMQLKNEYIFLHKNNMLPKYENLNINFEYNNLELNNSDKKNENKNFTFGKEIFTNFKTRN